MVRTAVAILSLTLVSAPVYADQLIDVAHEAQTAITPSAAPGTVTLKVSVTKEPTTTQRPAALPMLYASYATFQLFDGYQTIRGVARGGQETNPLMTGLVGSPAAVWTVKAASSVMAITAAERMWKTNKAGAIAVMVVANGLSAAVAARNASVLKQLR